MHAGPTANKEAGKQDMDSNSIRIGAELNQTYRIDARIGVGGMAEVFKGHNIQTGDPAAIKLVLPEFARNEMILELFRKEARVLNHLSHDAIVRYYVFTFDQAIGRPYLAMEFVSGPSLSDHLRSGPLSEDDTASLQKRLSDGLLRAHGAGVIHRDISPDNIILPDGDVKRAKIIDFGIARSENVGGVTLLGDSFAGKYNYVSPEQLGLYGGDVTHRSDIYSLGLVLAAALRGLPLNMQGSQVEVIEKRRAVPDLSTVPERFRGLLSAMLEPDPAKRLQSMAQVRDWVPGVSGVQGSAADATVVLRHGIPLQEAAVGQSVMSGGNPNPKSAEQKRSPRGVFLLLGGALAVAVVLGVLSGVLFLGRERAGQGESEPEAMSAAAEMAQPGQNEQTSRAEAANSASPSAPSIAGKTAAEAVQDKDAGQAAPAATGNAGSLRDRSKPSATADSQAGETLGIPTANGSALPASEPESSEQATKAQPNVAILEPPAVPPATVMPQAPAEQPAPKPTPAQEKARPAPEPKSAEQVTGAQSTVPMLEPPAAAPSQQAPQAPAEQPAPTLEPQKEVAVLGQPKPPPMPNIPAQMADYVVSYQGGDCFFAQLRDMSATPVRVLGMGASQDVFENFMTSFTARFGTEPDINLNMVTPRQCPAVDALRHLTAPASDGGLSLSIESTLLPAGGALNGQIAGAQGRHLDLLFVSDKGETFKLTSLVEGGKFSVQFGRNSVPAASDPLPQLLLLVASDRELTSLSALNERQSQPADVVFPTLLKEAAQGADVSMEARYFKIQR